MIFSVSNNNNTRKLRSQMFLSNPKKDLPKFSVFRFAQAKGEYSEMKKSTNLILKQICHEFLWKHNDCRIKRFLTSSVFVFVFFFLQILSFFPLRLFSRWMFFFPVLIQKQKRNCLPCQCWFLLLLLLYPSSLFFFSFIHRRYFCRCIICFVFINWSCIMLLNA